MSKSLYEIIGVNRDADTKIIEAKCLELGKQYNPKINPDDLEAAIIYKEILTAYVVLRNPIKRAEYDASLAQASLVVITPEIKLTIPSIPLKNVIDCPDCGATNVQRLSLIHTSGITNVDLTSKGSSIGIGGAHVMGGGNALGVGLSKNKSKINGIQQTELSKLASPPINAVSPVAGGAIGAAIIAAIGVFVAFKGDFSIASYIVAIVVALIEIGRASCRERV